MQESPTDDAIAPDGPGPDDGLTGERIGGGFPDSPTLPGGTATGEPSSPVLLRERAAALVEVLLCSGFPTQLLLLVILRTLGIRAQTADGTMVPAFVFTLSLLDAALLIGLIFYFIRDGRERIRDVFLGPRPVAREVAFGFALVPVVFFFLAAIMAIVLTVAPRMHNVEVNPLGAMMQTRRDALIFAVVVTVAGGVREEIQRAFILHRFEQYLGGGALGVLLFSAAFGLGHIQQGHDAVIATGALGALWGVTYLLRRSVVAPVVSHATFNLIQLLKFTVLR